MLVRSGAHLFDTVEVWVPKLPYRFIACIRTDFVVQLARFAPAYSTLLHVVLEIEPESELNLPVGADADLI